MAVSNVARRILRGLGWVVLGLGSIALLVLAAWVASNWRDAEQTPRPAELAPPVPRLADNVNAAYAFVGLLAEAGRDPAATGRALREAERSRMALPPAARASSATAGSGSDRDLLGKALVTPKGPPLHCAAQGLRCDDAWFAQTDALDKQRAGFGAVGERCDKLLAGPLEFEELLPPTRGIDAPLMNWAPMVECSRWFRSGAIVALARGQREQALAQLERAQRLHEALWQGAQTLIGHMVSTRVARATFDTMAAAALREPALADTMAPWLATPMDARPGARRWMQFEADFQRGAIETIRPSAATVAAFGETALLGGVDAGALTALGNWLTGHGIGFHTERTVQKSDAQWRQRLSRLTLPWPALMEAAAADERAFDQAATHPPVKWRNTFGELVLDVARPAYRTYLARHADHELHREATALVLGLQRQRVPAAGRAEATRQWPGLSDTLRQRLKWSADGRTLEVRSWQSEAAGASFDPRRDAISFTWPQ